MSIAGGAACSGREVDSRDRRDPGHGPGFVHGDHEVPPVLDLEGADPDPATCSRLDPRSAFDLDETHMGYVSAYRLGTADGPQRPQAGTGTAPAAVRRRRSPARWRARSPIRPGGGSLVPWPRNDLTRPGTRSAAVRSDCATSMGGRSPPGTQGLLGKGINHSFPLSTYSAPGGLPQDPGHAAESSPGARTCGNGGRSAGAVVDVRVARRRRAARTRVRSRTGVPATRFITTCHAQRSQATLDRSQ
ncbi:hypothetical protein SAMN05444920_113160 [Nonomuraea solani]|uniref:Uncharacterized protein n=1 Tax=Nonomuraea solani TaxID=1144553 RepID=A0A1H6ES82_9ACTN|nr:hypothetical protein SAMN05444920_113160 [Nonomuraea solani]